MLCRFVLRSPSRLSRTASPSSPHDSLANPFPLRSRNFIPPATALLQQQQLLQHRQQVLPISGGKPAKADPAVKDVSWSVHRNHLRNQRNLKVALMKAEADPGIARRDDIEPDSLEDGDVLSQVERRIPDVTAVMTFEDAPESGFIRDKESVVSASFTHDDYSPGKRENKVYPHNEFLSVEEKHPTNELVGSNEVEETMITQRQADPALAIAKNFKKKKKKNDEITESQHGAEVIAAKAKSRQVKVKKKRESDAIDRDLSDKTPANLDSAFSEPQKLALQEYIERREAKRREQLGTDVDKSLSKSKPKAKKNTKTTDTKPKVVVPEPQAKKQKKKAKAQATDDGLKVVEVKSLPKQPMKKKKSSPAKAIPPESSIVSGQEALADPQPVSEESIKAHIDNLPNLKKEKTKKAKKKKMKSEDVPMAKPPKGMPEQTYFSTYSATALNEAEEENDSIANDEELESMFDDVVEGKQETDASFTADKDNSFAFFLDRSVNRSHELASYLKTCVYGGHLEHAESVMRLYAMENYAMVRDPQVEQLLHVRKHGEVLSIKHFGMERTIHKYYANLTSAFNVLLREFLKRDNLEKFSFFLGKMLELGVEINPKTASLALTAHARYSSKDAVPPKGLVSAVENILDDPKFPLDQLPNLSKLNSAERAELKSVLREYGIETNKADQRPHYIHPILDSLNEEKDAYPNPYFGAFDKESIQTQLKETLQFEKEGRVSVESIAKNDRDSPDPSPGADSRLTRHQQKWRRAMSRSLEKKLRFLKLSKFENSQMSLWPYLEGFSADELMDLMLDNITDMLQSKNYNLHIGLICRRLGMGVFEKFVAKIHPLSDEKALSEIYDRYLDFLCSETRSVPTERHFWESMREEFEAVSDYESFNYWWPQSVIQESGRLLLDIIVGDVMFDIDGKRDGNLPVFYKFLVRAKNNVYTNHTYEIKIHPAAILLYENAPPQPQKFVVTEVPMAVPPIPWLGLDIGGNIIQRNETIRHYAGSRLNKEYCQKVPPERLFPIYDSLNHIGTCPWRVNGSVLDVAKDVFNSGGHPRLSLPPPRETFVKQLEDLPTLSADLSQEDRRQILNDRKRLVKGQMETHSLWCTQSYKLSLAQRMRNSVLWYPINMDFRGRVYPVPPHLNHMGDDLTRGLMEFAKSKALGPKGLDWLKIQVINLTGLKKRDSVANRLLYADEILDDILDSARRPLDGRRWWLESEEPWETLAACKEVADALDCPGGPEHFQSSLPVHQDGSCNGLQHYAALGRDLAGGRSVNLCQSEFPKDVYSDVLELVVEKIRRDANEGNAQAQALDGFVTRKVIKQTIMTTVYGVTRYGARLQVEGRLKELKGFPREAVWDCSVYLSGATLECLEEMFVATKKIQDWFDDIALLVSKSFRQPVSWETPLGLPVLQPYFKEKSGGSGEKVKTTKRFPDSQKQKNGFPPNFIHSLDATHMMLTSLHAYRRGICFNAVHDCFWTHAADVDAMNEICREEFVKLHSLPILEDLANHVKQIAPPETELTGNTRQAKLFREVVESVPRRGELDIGEVLKSVYFFS